MSLPQSRSSAANNEELKARIAELTARLEEAEDTLRAIRDGDVDAIVVGSDVYTLDTATSASNRLSADILAQVSDAVIVTDFEERVTFLNAAAERQYGVSTSDVLGRGFAEMYTRHWPAPDAEAGMWTALGERGEWRGELIHRTHDGRELHVEKAITALHDPDGAPCGHVAVIRDITDRKRAELELHTSEEFNRSVIESSPDCLKVIATDGTVLSLNENGCKLLRLAEPAVLIGKKWWNIWPEESRALVQNAVVRASRGEEVRFECEGPIATGEVKWWNVEVSPVRNPDGSVSRILAVSRDITAHIFRERNLVFLADMQRVFAPLTTSKEIMRAASERLAEHLGLIHCALVEVDEPADTCTVLHDRNAPGTRNLAGDYRLSDFFLEEEQRVLASGAPLVIANVRDGGRTAMQVEHFKALGICAVLNAGYVSGGRWRFVLHASRAEPYAWPAEAVELVSELAASVYVRVERARAEEALRHREEQFRLAAQVAGLAVSEIDYATDQVHLTPESALLFGLHPQPLVVSRAAIHALFHPVDRPALEALIAASHDPAGTGEFALDHRIIRPDGETRWHSVRKQIFFEDGRPARALLVLFDITERKRAEQALADRTDLLNGVLESTTDVIFAKDLNGRLLLVNTACAAAFGSPHDQVVGKTCEELFPPDLAAAIRQHDEAVTTSGSPIQLEETVPVAGEPRIYLTLKAPLRDDSGRVVGVLGISRDITERKRTEEALLASETRFRIAVGIVSSIVWTNNAQGMMTDEQPGWANFTGQTLEEYQGYGWAKAVHPDDAQPTINKWNQAVAEKRTFEFQHRVRRHDGEWRLCSVRAIPVLLNDGTISEWLGVHTDISERNRAEEMLRENAELFSTLIAQAPMGTYVVDAQFRMREINTEAMKTFGSLQPLIGRDFQEILEILWGAELGVQISNIFRHTLATGERYVSPPFTKQRHDLGIEQSYEWQTQRVTLPDGQRGVVCYFHEVTERMQATAALQASQERMRLAAEATGVGIWTWNVLTNTIRWDASMFNIYGIEPKLDGLVHYQDWSGAVLPEDLAENEAILQDSVQRCGQSTREFRIRRRSDGECRWIQSVETVRANQNGKAEWVLGTNLDVTERVASAEALHMADRRKDEFLATLAHELRNPLAPVRNGLQILKLTNDRNIAQRTQAMMERQLGHMVRLIDDLLEVSRISSGKVVLHRERIELQSAVHSAIETARPHIDAKRHVLQLKIASEPIWLRADATRVSQVVSNLLTNAAKYSPLGSRICIGAHREGNDAVVTVDDDGEGIPQNMLAEIFEMFTQIDRTLDRAQGGLGIGLALVRRLVDLHGGTVTAQSAGLGAGSTFTVRLPTLADADAADGNVAPLDEAMATTKLRVLVVDDNVDAAESLAELLSIDGHECRVADSGAAALVIVREFKPALVFLDIGMPGMNGYETARRIRAEDPSRQLTLAALTGMGAEADRIKATEAGFDHHFTKPVEPAKVNGVLQLVAVRQAKLATASAAGSG